MANIFIDGDEIANQKDLNRLLGQNDTVSDSLDNHISETGIYPTKQANGAGYPNNTTDWGAFTNLHAGDKFLQIFFDDSNNVYFRTCNENYFKTHGRDFNQVATKDDVTSLQDQINQLKSKLGGVRLNYISLPYLLKEVA